MCGVVVAPKLFYELDSLGDEALQVTAAIAMSDSAVRLTEKRRRLRRGVVRSLEHLVVPLDIIAICTDRQSDASHSCRDLCKRIDITISLAAPSIRIAISNSPKCSPLGNRVLVRTPPTSPLSLRHCLSFQRHRRSWRAAIALARLQGPTVGWPPSAGLCFDHYEE